MVNSLSKVLVVATMLIALVGQAFAYSAMSCEMTGASHGSHINMAADTHSDMNHDGMHHGVVDHDVIDHGVVDHSLMNHDTADLSNTDEDCCESECSCPASACTNLSIVNSEASSSAMIQISEAVSMQPTSQTKSISSSLYRPPIFA